MKRRIPCIIGEINRNALAVLTAIAKKKSVPLLKASPGTQKYVGLPFHGTFFERSVSIALTALEVLKNHHFVIPSSAILKGLHRLKENTGLRGRYEVLREHPKLIIDVGHNPDAIYSIVAQLKREQYRELRLVFGVMADKDYRKMIRSLSELDPIVYAVQPRIERALPSAKIVEQFTRLHCRICFSGNVSEGITLALKDASRDDLLLIHGSFYVVGEALEFLHNKHRLKKA